MDQTPATRARWLRILSVGLAGALSAFAIPVPTAPPKPPPPAIQPDVGSADRS